MPSPPTRPPHHHNSQGFPLWWSALVQSHCTVTQRSSHHISCHLPHLSFVASKGKEQDIITKPAEVPLCKYPPIVSADAQAAKLNSARSWQVLPMECRSAACTEKATSRGKAEEGMPWKTGTCQSGLCILTSFPLHA